MRRRVSRPEAARPPVQDPGLPARRAPRDPRGDQVEAADDGHLLLAADAGRVLLLGAVRGPRPLPLCAEPRRARRGGRARGRPERRGRRADLPRHRGKAARDEAAPRAAVPPRAGPRGPDSHVRLALSRPPVWSVSRGRGRSARRA